MKYCYKKILIFLFVLILVQITGCMDTENSKKEELSSELNILNWEDYFAPNIIEDFEEKYNVTITIDTFDEENYMISQLETNPGDYDVVITSDISVRELIATKTLATLDKNNIPNLKNINSKFLDKSFDPGNLYSIPYLWGTTGIAYNSSAINEEITSWSALWNTTYNGTIGMLDNTQEVIGATLKYLGYSLNPSNLTQIQEAENLLLIQKNLIQGYFGSMDIINKLVNGELKISQCYSGDAFFAADMNENITYVIPEEGASIWIDNLIIPADSPNKYTAEVFINYILSPQVSANITNYQWYANPNEEAKSFIDSEILETPGIYPSESVLEKCEFFEELNGEMNNEYNRVWSNLKN